jgi:segregation and condensation protein A
MSFTVEQVAFSGPLALLLDLLDQRELEIKDVDLAKITDDYLTHLDTADVPVEAQADFLLVASRLIYLKSKELMPHLRIEEEEDEVASLEDQLRLYKMFQEAAGKVEALYTSSSYMFRRPYVKLKRAQEVSFLAPQNVDVSKMQEAFGWILKRLEPFFALQQASIERVKSVEERIEEIQMSIRDRATMRFRDVMAGAQSKAEVVVSFLALLELVKRRIVVATQRDGHDITIQRI